MQYNDPMHSNKLTQNEFEHYQTDGFLVRENLLSKDQVEAVKQAFRDMVNTYANDRDRGEIIPGSGDQITSGQPAFCDAVRKAEV